MHKKTHYKQNDEKLESLMEYREIKMNKKWIKLYGMCKIYKKRKKETKRLTIFMHCDRMWIN